MPGFAHKMVGNGGKAIAPNREGACIHGNEIKHPFYDKYRVFKGVNSPIFGAARGL